jgi:hypothetical protein
VVKQLLCDLLDHDRVVLHLDRRAARQLDPDAHAIRRGRDDHRPKAGRGVGGRSGSPAAWGGLTPSAAA